MTGGFLALVGASLAVGAVHTLAGPDHYLPFVMLARAQRWSGGKLLVVTGLCGLGHILSSVLLGFAAVYGGRALAERLGWMEAWRGDVAGWLLFGLGFAYALWGVRVAMRSRPHAHVHDHGDGEIHEHAHDHFEEHAHAHGATRVTFWTLFIIFVLGPCEPLVPIIVAAAAEGLSYGAMALVCGAFGAATVGTMLLVAWLGFRGLTLVRLGTLERYAHALAGGVIAASGAAILWLGL